MAELLVPSAGLLLDGFMPTTNAAAAPSATKIDPVQVMQLDLQEVAWQELLKCARHGGKPIQVSFGKNISLHYGTKTCRLNATPSKADIQFFETSATEDVNNLAFAGRMSHILAMQKAQEDIAGADEALLKLKNSLASAKQAKESNRIKYVPDSSQLPPPVKRTANSLKQSKQKGSSLGFIKKSPYLHNPSPRPQVPSQTASPTHTPSYPDTRAIPTSIPQPSKEKERRLQAIRIPLIHLLAIRPFSTKYLAQHIHCTQDEIDQILQKVGKKTRLDPSKWDLNDRNYKDLDVWKFNYAEQQDRDLAIERAVGAFDRMRLSQEEPKWQMLYPPNERGKGKTLSRFDRFHKGPIQQSSTPRIHVQHPEEGTTETRQQEANSVQAGHLTPSASENSPHLKAGDKVKSAKASSEKADKTKRLLSKGPKRAAPAPKTKESHPAVKGKGKKVVALPKSEEFVHDSDEEDGLGDAVGQSSASSPPVEDKKAKANPESAAPTPPTKVPTLKTKKALEPKARAVQKPAMSEKTSSMPHPTPASNATSNGSSKASAEEKDTGKGSSQGEVKTAIKKIPSSPAYTPGAKQRLSEANQGSTAMQKSHSRGRAVSSPHKPSPLGSSPPTNASEFENPDHSSLSATPPLNKKSITPSDAGRVAGHPRTGSATPVKINGHLHSPSSSDASLKRKANDIDSNIHDHGTPLLDTYTHGAKRHKPSSGPTPPESDDSSTSPLSEREIAIQEAQRFKALHAKYAKVYKEVSQQPKPSPEQIRQVTKMHKRLEEMKRSITRGIVAL